MENNCRWVKGTLPNTFYCREPVGWRMVPDGGEPGAALVRKYDSFCKWHKEMAAQQNKELDIQDDF